MTILIAFLLFVTTAAHADLQTPPPKDVAAIRAMEETFRTGWLKNDPNVVMSLFTADAALYPGGSKSVKGIDALQKYWFGPSDLVTTIERFEIEIEDIEGTPTYATVSGTNLVQWSTTKKDGSDRKQFIQKGRFFAIYIKQNSQWRIHKRFAASNTEDSNNGAKK